jgi:cytoskeletal protein CcmA (bactofilin family)
MVFSNATLSILVLASLSLAILAIVLLLPGAMRDRTRRPRSRSGVPTEGRLDVLIDGHAKAIRRLEAAVRKLALAERRLGQLTEEAVRHVGVVRFDAFEDMGGRLSFSAALLDSRGDGVVITSINGRQETRCSARPSGRRWREGARIGCPSPPDEEEAMFRRNEADERHDRQAINPREVRMKNGSGSEVTVVGQGASLEGTVVSTGSLRIDGRVTGKINADGDVVLSSHSQVEADISAQNVTIAGRFKGNIVAKGTAELARGGRVEGNVTSKSLMVAEGAFFSGQSVMDQQAAGGAPGATSDRRADGDGATRPVAIEGSRTP